MHVESGRSTCLPTFGSDFEDETTNSFFETVEPSDSPARALSLDEEGLAEDNLLSSVRNRWDNSWNGMKHKGRRVLELLLPPVVVLLARKL